MLLDAVVHYRTDGARDDEVKHLAAGEVKMEWLQRYCNRMVSSAPHLRHRTGTLQQYHGNAVVERWKATGSFS